jgi:hypothetical protein
MTVFQAIEACTSSSCHAPISASLVLAFSLTAFYALLLDVQNCPYRGHDRILRIHWPGVRGRVRIEERGKWTLSFCIQ